MASTLARRVESEKNKTFEKNLAQAQKNDADIQEAYEYLKALVDEKIAAGVSRNGRQGCQVARMG